MLGRGGHGLGTGRGTPFLCPLMPSAGTPRSFNLGSKAQKALGGASSVTFSRFASARRVSEHKTQVQTNHHLPLPPKQNPKPRLSGNPHIRPRTSGPLGLPSESRGGEHGSSLRSGGHPAGVGRQLHEGQQPGLLAPQCGHPYRKPVFLSDTIAATLPTLNLGFFKRQCIRGRQELSFGQTCPPGAVTPKHSPL